MQRMMTSTYKNRLEPFFLFNANHDISKGGKLVNSRNKDVKPNLPLNIETRPNKMVYCLMGVTIISAITAH